jgi:hypothetical protein
VKCNYVRFISFKKHTKLRESNVGWRGASNQSDVSVKINIYAAWAHLQRRKAGGSHPHYFAHGFKPNQKQASQDALLWTFFGLKGPPAILYKYQDYTFTRRITDRHLKKLRLCCGTQVPAPCVSRHNFSPGPNPTQCLCSFAPCPSYEVPSAHKFWRQKEQLYKYQDGIFTQRITASTPLHPRSAQAERAGATGDSSSCAHKNHSGPKFWR